MTPEAAVLLASQHMTERKDITSQEVQLYVRGYHIYTLDMNENLRASKKRSFPLQSGTSGVSLS